MTLDRKRKVLPAVAILLVLSFFFLPAISIGNDPGTYLPDKCPPPFGQKQSFVSPSFFVFKS